MRNRRLGNTDLVVSEVGFGTWTLVSDWWGRSDDPHDMIKAALDAGINFIDTAPVYGNDGAGESILRDYLSARDDLVLTTKVGYDIEAERRFPGQSERPHDWEPESVRRQVEASLTRLGTDRIDLLQLHNPRIEPIVDDALWETLLALKAEGKVRELGVALGPAIGWVEEGNIAIDDRPIATLQTVFNILDNFEKASTLEFLWAPESGRTIGQAAIAGILANETFACVLPTVLSVDEVREYAAASDVPLSPAEKEGLADLWSRNFDHVDRYVMPLKSSV